MSFRLTEDHRDTSDVRRVRDLAGWRLAEVLVSDALPPTGAPCRDPADPSRQRSALWQGSCHPAAQVAPAAAESNG
jgi:hypothetical protein